MGFPNKKEIKKMAEKLEKLEGSLHLNDDATPLELFRWQLCQKLLAYKQDNNLKQREIAEMLEVDEAIVSKIFHHRIEKISTDKLIEYALIVDPNMKLGVS